MAKHTNGDRAADELRADLFRRFSPKGLRRQRRRRILNGAAWFVAVRLVGGLKRCVDFLLAALLLIAFSPVFAVAALWLGAGGKVFQRRKRVGRWGIVFEQLLFRCPDSPAGRFMRWSGLRSLPALVNILRGDMSWVGPRSVAPGELSASDRQVRRRYNVRPGALSPWWIRRRANIDYEGEAVVDAEYVENHSLRGDVGILLRAVPAMLYGPGVATAPDRVRVLGVRLNNLTMAEAVDEIARRVESGEPGHVSFVNADCVNIACRDREYADVLNRSSLVLADGIGLKLAGKILGWDIRQNVNGTDMFPRLCGRLRSDGRSVYLLGAKPGVAEAAAEWVARHFAGLRVAGARHGYFSQSEEPEVVREIAASGADVLLVAMGAPAQEKWIAAHLADCGAKVGLGVGGLFDFYSGRVRRAPAWMREIGLEWFYRFLQEPGRMWKRYFVGNFVFLWRALRERARGSAGEGEGWA